MTDSGPPDAVLAAAFPGRTVTGVRHHRSRESYGTYEVTVEGDPDPLFLKYTRDAGWRLRKEAAVLRLLADVDDVPVPSVRSRGTVAGGEDRTYLLTTKCEGRTGREVLRDDADRAPEVVRTVGRVLAHLHERTAFPRPGNVVADPDTGEVTLAETPTTWLGVLRELIRSMADVLRGTAFEQCADRGLEVLDGYRDDVGDVASPRLLHCDPNPRNVHFADGALSCLLDWEYAKVGDPAYDLATAEARISEGDAAEDADRGTLLDGYREVRPVPEAFDRRREVYRVLFPLGRMVSLCGGSESGGADPAVAESGRGRRLRREARRRVERLERRP